MKKEHKRLLDLKYPTRQDMRECMWLGKDIIDLLEDKIRLLDTCHWIQIREGINSHWVSSCGGKNLKETFDLCPLCQKEVSKTFI